MKDAARPSVPVEAELREGAERVLRDRARRSSLIDTAVRETMHRRRVHDEFLARGIRSSEDAKGAGIYHSASAVHTELHRRLDARR